MDLLVSYPWGKYQRARSEIRKLLDRFGDPHPRVEKTGTIGIAIAHTELDNRTVIQRCHALRESEPLDAFEFTIKWVPVDYWCSTDLDAMKEVIDHKIKQHIGENQTWGMRVHKRRWQRYHSIEIVEYLAADIPRKVNLRNPDWIVWVDVIGRQTAISLLRPEEIFSLGLPQL